MTSLKKVLIAVVIVLGVCVILFLFLLICRNPYYRGKVDFQRDEIQKLFAENEEKFEYIINMLKNVQISEPGGYIEVKRNNKHEIVLYTLGKYNIDTKKHARIYLELNMDDKLFNQYIKELLVDNKLGEIYWSTDGETVNFGPNRPIIYSESIPFDLPEDVIFDEFGPVCGVLKENWYYYVQQFI